jgi:hypothetical protein
MSGPEKRFKCGACETAIFENEIRTNARTIAVKKTAIQKRYRTADGQWKSTQSLDVNEIPKMILVLTKAYEYLAMGGDSGDDQAAGDL